MLRKHYLGIGFIGALLVSSLLLLKTPASTASAAPVPAEEPTCCKKDPVLCTPVIKEEPGPSTPLENLSHQFIAFPGLSF